MVMKHVVDQSVLALALIMGTTSLAPRSQAKCPHSDGRVNLPSGSIGASWINPRRGPQFFCHTFHNQSSVLQTFTQSVEGEFKCTFEASMLLSLSLSQACAKVGTEVVVRMTRSFPVNIPPHSNLVVAAYANLMQRSIEMLTTCRDCHEVLSVQNGWVTAMRGISEYFQKQ
jgi:hypothetical protein